jgi:hypothetical protein
MTDNWEFEDQTAEARRASELELLNACAADGDVAEGDGAPEDPVLQLTRRDQIDHWVTTASGSVYRLVWDPAIRWGFRMRQPRQSETFPTHVGISHLRDGLSVGVVDVIELALGRDMVLTVTRIDGIQVTNASTTVVSIRRAEPVTSDGAESDPSPAALELAERVAWNQALSGRVVT